MKNAVLQVLLRVFVTRYYQINAGFFLIVFLLLFGIAEPAASIRLHHALMQMMAARTSLLLAGCLVWTLYYVKCIAYFLQAAGGPQYLFLCELQALPARRLQWYIAGCLAALYMPAILYAACTAGVAIAAHRYTAAALIAGFQAAALAAGASLCHRRIMHTARETRLRKMTQALGRLRPAGISLYQYLPAFALRHKKVLLLLLKSGSLLLLQLMVAINRDEPERAGTFYVLLFIIMAHGLLPYHFIRFTEAHGWLRNLPLSSLRRYGHFAATYALLVIPELVFLLLHVHTVLSVGDMLSFYVLAVAMLCGMHTMLYLRGMGVERYTLVLACVFPLTIISLAIVSIWWLSAGWLLASLLLFPVLHRRYEAVME